MRALLSLVLVVPLPDTSAKLTRFFFYVIFSGASFNSGLPESAWKVCLAGRSDGKMKMFWTMESFSGSLVISSVKKGCHSFVIVR